MSPSIACNSMLLQMPFADLFRKQPAAQHKVPVIVLIKVERVHERALSALDFPSGNAATACMLQIIYSKQSVAAQDIVTHKTSRYVASSIAVSIGQQESKITAGCRQSLCTESREALPQEVGLRCQVRALQPQLCMPGNVHE